MTSTHLPLEIILHVASYLDKKDIRQCISVNKTWYNVFRQPLYNSIRLSNRCQLKRLLSTIQTRACGSLIKHLQLDDTVGLTQDEFAILPYYMPYLESLNFAPQLWEHHQYTPSLAIWRRLHSLPLLDCRSRLAFQLLVGLGHQLTKLSLSANLLRELVQNDLLVSFLSLAPNVKELVLGATAKTEAQDQPSRQSSVTKTNINMMDLEAIHQTLPHLTDLHLSNVCLAAPAQPAEGYPHGTNLSSLSIHGTMAHYTWLHYVAFKYPLLESIDLDVQWDRHYKHSMTFQEQLKAKQGLIRIAESCTQLDKIRLGEFCTKLQCNQAFFAALRSHPSEVDALAMASPAYMYNKSSLDDFYALIRSGHASLKTLRLRLWRDLPNLKIILSALRQCTQLTELELSCTNFAHAWNYGCELDTILAHCPQLKTLKVSLSSFVLSRHPIRISHALERLELNQVHFNANVFDYLAECCPKLEHLTMQRCVKEFDGTNEIRIAMPAHTFSSVQLDHLHLRPSDLVQKCYTDAAVFHVHSSNTVNTKATHWYHLEESHHQRRLVPLCASQIEFVEQYPMSEDDWDNLEDAGARQTYRSNEDFTEDVPFGYVSFSCRDVMDKMTLNGLRV